MSDERSQRERDFFADWKVNAAGDALRWKRELRLLRRARPDGLGRVLSLGCGRGWFETQLAPFADAVLGIDLSPESIADAQRLAAEKGLSNVEFQCEDVITFALDRTFDTVICVGFLHHLTDAEGVELLTRIHDHLAPDGLLHTQDPNRRGILRTVGRVVLGDRYDRYHTEDERELDPDRVRQMFLEAGFREATVRYMDLTLIPAMQLLHNAPGWTMHGFALADRVWCRSPTKPWSSGFAVDAVK